jgi:hypothetical protein
MSTTKTKNKRKNPLSGKSLNQLINESNQLLSRDNMIGNANEWLYSKISRSKFKEHPHNKLSRKVTDKRVNFFMEDEGIKKDVIESILRCQNNIKNVHYMKPMSRDNGEYTFRIKFNGKILIVSEFDIYDYDWFMEALSELYNNIDIETIIEKRKRKIATYVDNGKVYDSSYIRYSIIEKITGGDFSFEKNFEKARNEIKATITK